MKKKVTLEDLQKEIKELRKEVEKKQQVVIINPVTIPQIPYYPSYPPYPVYPQPYTWITCGQTICSSGGQQSY